MHVQRDELRSLVAPVWARVLEREVDDATDFFDAGGHSFLAMRLTAALDQLLPVSVLINLLFDYPRLGDFLRAVAAKMEAPAVSR